MTECKICKRDFPYEKLKHHYYYDSDRMEHLALECPDCYIPDPFDDDDDETAGPIGGGHHSNGTRLAAG